jgi:hypothetical protein
MIFNKLMFKTITRIILLCFISAVVFSDSVEAKKKKSKSDIYNQLFL